jgi:NAD(P)-dependent dehydrogenase (short-subunit alcohol dehydrogenase family)
VTEKAVVTGAGSGIGRACAEELARRGLEVLCIGRRRSQLNETAAGIQERGGQAVVISADIATDDGIATVNEAIIEANVVALVHAAGRDSVTKFAGTSRAEVEAVLATNLTGPFLLTQALIDKLTEHAGVVFIGSIAASAGRHRAAAYGASKAALIGLTRQLAVELAPKTRVNCVVPGATLTPMLEQFVSSYAGDSPDEETIGQLQAAARRSLLGRAAEPLEIAATVVHIVLDATAMTGAVVPVDLGYTAS